FTGLEESLLPHRMSLEEGNLEEERRLVYVGITRAMEQLYLSACRFRRTGGSFDPRLPSRFLEEMGIQTRRERSYDEFDSSWSDSSRSYSERKVVSRPAPDSGSSALNLVPGDRVRHKSFGTGEIENTDKTPAGTKLTIRFDDGTTRRFLDRYTPLEKI
ncbi:MAG: AAA family ATPase, partial [Spirochaetae bacterium HGW-Spirochaetae-10]